MNVVISIPPKDLKEIFVEMLEGELYENFDSKALKMAGVPKKADLINTLINDEAYINNLSARIAGYVKAYVIDRLFEEVYDVKCPTLASLVKACEQASDKIEAAERKQFEKDQEQEEAQRVQRMIKALTSAGYKITKK